ncbi:MAG: nitroreductase [Lachnospiraceae bacterium]|nr:nitroreductase [Lachnospiraceae bacterium]
MKIDFPVEENIRRRKSVRSYDGTILTKEEEKQIDDYIELLAQEESPFPAKVTIKRIKAGDGVDAERLGTYGIIKGTRLFVGVTVENVAGAMEAVGYVFERFVLYMEHLGLGTCWMAGTFNRNDFENAMEVNENELFAIISPIGHPAEKRRMFDKVMRKTIGADKRKEWEELFFLNDFQTPISKEEAGAYAYPLEMVRLAPSAVNGQPWRIVKKDGVFHFYKAGEVQPDKIYDVRKMDLGIAAAHFELAAMDKSIAGRFEKLDAVQVDGAEKYEYVFSWVEE